jgi:hypothetical protein
MMHRLTFNLNGGVSDDLEYIETTTADNHTDSIGKAIRLRALHLRAEARGARLAIVEPDGTTATLLIL